MRDLRILLSFLLALLTVLLPLFCIQEESGYLANRKIQTDYRIVLRTGEGDRIETLLELFGGAE